MGIKKDYRIIKKSNLFDEEYYLRTYPDVRQADIDPLKHFVNYGWKEGRNPSKEFDTSFYLSNYSDVKEAKINPLVHYIKWGKKEGRRCGGGEDFVIVQTFSHSKDFSSKVFKLAKRFFFLFKNYGVKFAFSKAVGKIIRFVKNKGKKNFFPTSKTEVFTLNEDSAFRNLNLEKIHDFYKLIFPEFSYKSENYKEYEKLSSLLDSYERKRIENFHPEFLNLIKIKKENVEKIIKNLIFKIYPTPQVSIVIPVLNNLFVTIECLISIKSYTKNVAYELIIVDDGSENEVSKTLKKIKGIKYIRNPKNRGFGYSCNLGAKEGRGNYLLFLNNDVQVKDENWLKNLIDIFEKFENVGIVGPKVIYPDGRLQESGARMNIDGTSQMIGLFDNPSLPRYNYIREVEYCSGVCLLVKKEIFERVGGFSKEFYPAYFEDSDLCFKVREFGHKVCYNPNSIIIHHLSYTSNKINEEFKLQCISKNRQKFLEKWSSKLKELNKVKLIAFYLPQFHPIPENDLWWGKGFTEWSNVTKAKPNYIGHIQPNLPADLGFYDLRVEKVLEEQAKLAKNYGIYGFCFYYYWFGGKKLLDMPLERILEKNIPDIPFCLCWANENWTRRWDGLENEILMRQEYSEENHEKIIKDLLKFFHHPNYIKINDRPLFLLYRLFPDVKKATEIWRDVCRKEGIGEIYLCFVESFEQAIRMEDPRNYGFDASVEFPPHQACLNSINSTKMIINPDFKGETYSYSDAVIKYVTKELPPFTRFRTVMPRWDNTPRRQNDSCIFDGANPEAFQVWLEKIIQQTLEQNFGERIVFINAWNEWAEGNYLEPDKIFGRMYLEAVSKAIKKFCVSD